MTASYDEKREAFQRMLAGRLPKAVKAVELLANLSRKSDYAWTSPELQSMVDQLEDALDMVLQSFGVPTTGEPEPAPAPLPAKPAADGQLAVGIDQRAEVRWAHDALRRGDKELAENRLTRVIGYWIKEGKAIDSWRMEDIS